MGNTLGKNFYYKRKVLLAGRLTDSFEINLAKVARLRGPNFGVILKFQDAT